MDRLEWTQRGLVFASWPSVLLGLGISWTTTVNPQPTLTLSCGPADYWSCNKITSKLSQGIPMCEGVPISFVKSPISLILSAFRGMIMIATLPQDILAILDKVQEAGYPLQPFTHYWWAIKVAFSHWPSPIFCFLQFISIQWREYDGPLQLSHLLRTHTDVSSWRPWSGLLPGSRQWAHQDYNNSTWECLPRNKRAGRPYVYQEWKHWGLLVQ